MQLHDNFFNKKGSLTSLNIAVNRKLLCSGICLSCFYCSMEGSRARQIHKNEEQQAQSGNSLVPVTLSPLVFSFSSLVLSFNLKFCYLLHSTSGLYHHLHFSPSLLHSVPGCSSERDANMDFIDIFTIQIRSSCLTLNPSISFSFAYPYWLHLTAHTCFLTGILKPRLSQ